MGDEWIDCKLGDLGEFRNGVNFNSTQEGVGLPVIKVKDFGDLTIAPDSGFDELNPQAIRIPADQMVEVGDTLIIRSNGNPALVGRSMLYRGGTKPTTFSGFCIRFRPDRSKIVPAFAAYFIRSPLCRQHFTAYGSGTGIQNLSQGVLTNLDISLPPLPEQRAIARVLGGLDDKIELNRRMNRTLEDLARGLFRSWFVDFDPVTRAAAGGLGRPGSTPGPRPTRTPPPHTPPWPTRLVDSPLGPIPEGWRVSTIGQEVTVVGGSTPSTDEPKFWEGGKHCWVTPRDLSRLTDPVVIDCERRITDAGLTQISSGLMPRGTVLLSSRAPIGYLAIADVPVAVNQGFIGLKCDKGLPGVFALRWCEENMEEVLSRAGGTTFAEISKAAFRPIPMVVPTAEVIEAFARAAQGWHDQIVANVRQSRQLAALRDALLPQLLSGEIRLREAERAVDDSLRPTSAPARGEGHPRPVARAAAGITKGRA